MNDINFRLLANQPIRELIPYQPGKPIEEVERELGITSAIKLASNENPLGCSPKALLAAQNALNNMHMYPDGGCYQIKNALARFLNVDTAQLTMGNGSENILEIIMKSYLDAQSSAVISEYAFLTIPILIKSIAAKMIVTKAHAYAHDIKAMVSAVTDETRIIFIVNPNNPTGTYTNASDLDFLLANVPAHVLVVVDEAYHEYIQAADYPNTLALLAHHPNLIITRTFSKAYGLAALRLGYAISSPDIADILNRARLPFNVNSIAASAACAALEDHEHIARGIDLNDAGKFQLENGLKKLNLKYIPSLGNFIAIELPSDAMIIYQQLLLQGVIVRPLGAYQMPKYIRVTIGTTSQNIRFLNALEQVLLSMRAEIKI